MTAEWAEIPYPVLRRISERIIAEVPHVNRVAYDITSKPLGHDRAGATAQNLHSLRAEAAAAVRGRHGLQSSQQAADQRESERKRLVAAVSPGMGWRTDGCCKQQGKKKLLTNGTSHITIYLNLSMNAVRVSDAGQQGAS